jgi:hypothetical protein
MSAPLHLAFQLSEFATRLAKLHSDTTHSSFKVASSSKTLELVVTMLSKFNPHPEFTMQ